VDRIPRGGGGGGRGESTPFGNLAQSKKKEGTSFIKLARPTFAGKGKSCCALRAGERGKKKGGGGGMLFFFLGAGGDLLYYPGEKNGKKFFFAKG